MSEFLPFPKMARLSREVIITEKLDGTNAQIYIGEEGMLVGSRTRWITPQNDNSGFAAWAYANQDELMKLGPGQHFGEWWGQGIQRTYGLTEKRFSLFNAQRWARHDAELQTHPTSDPRITRTQERPPKCCDVVPILYRGVFDTEKAELCISLLKDYGSLAAPGFMKPEGIIVYHTAAGVGFKKTVEKDEKPKGQE